LNIGQSLAPTDGTDCSLSLGSAPPPLPDRVTVTLNGAPVPRDPSHRLGWDYIDSGATTIALYGPVCDTFKSSRSAEISVYFACP
jgi:hypothetical protein